MEAEEKAKDSYDTVKSAFMEMQSKKIDAEREFYKAMGVDYKEMFGMMSGTGMYPSFGSAGGHYMPGISPGMQGAHPLTYGGMNMPGPDMPGKMPAFEMVYIPGKDLSVILYHGNMGKLGGEPGDVGGIESMLEKIGYDSKDAPKNRGYGESQPLASVGYMK